MPFGIGRHFKGSARRTRNNPADLRGGFSPIGDFGLLGPGGYRLVDPSGRTYGEIERRFNRPNMPGAPTVGATPNMGDPAVLEAQEAERRRARGRASTILTGPQGLSAAPTLSDRSLFGY